MTGEKKKENRAWVVKATSPVTPSILSIWQGSDSQAVNPGVNPRRVSAREQKSSGAAPSFQSRDGDAVGGLLTGGCGVDWVAQTQPTVVG